MTPTNRRVSLALAALLLLTALASCTKPKPRIDEIVFWQPWPAAAVEPAVRAFEAATPNVHVSVHEVPLAALRDSLDAALAAGTPPDLCAIGSDELPERLAANALVDWSAGVADLRDSLVGWPLCTVGDAIYGLPWTLSPRVLVLRRDLVARAGLDASRPPQTWAQLRAAVARLQKLGGGVRAIGLPRGGAGEASDAFLALAWGNGGEMLSAELDSSRVDSPENLAALELLQSLRRGVRVAGPDTLRRELAAGRLAMIFDDGSAWARAASAKDASVAIAPLPRPDADRGTRATLADGVVLASFTGSRRKELALRLARTLVRPEHAQATAAALAGPASARLAADSAATARPDGVLGALAAQCATARFAPHAARWDSIRIALGGAVDDVLAGRRAAREALADADARVAALAGRR